MGWGNDVNAIVDTTFLTGGSFAHRSTQSPHGRSRRIQIEAAPGHMDTSSKPEASVRISDRWQAIKVAQIVALSVLPGAGAAHGVNASPLVHMGNTWAAFDNAGFPADPRFRLAYEEPAALSGVDFSHSVFLADNVSHLERLRDGWAGGDTCAPSESILRDVKAAMLAVDAIGAAPAIEVDDDGTVVFEWMSGHRSFCLTFNGNGDVIGTLSPWTPDYPAWRVVADDEISLADKLEDINLAEFFGRE